MPYVNIKVTREGGPDGKGPTAEEKAKLIGGVTDLLQRVLNKSPASTFVVIDEVSLDNWGIAGEAVRDLRSAKQNNTGSRSSAAAMPSSTGSSSWDTENERQ
jgi:4-oxalocrotonate tautomerase